MDKNRVAALVTALTPVTEKIAEGDPGSLTVKARETADGGTNFRGSYFDEQQMDAIMATPDDVIHPDLKSVIKAMNDAIKEGKGAPFLADYWKAITGRGYDSKARMKVQLFTPIGMQISSAGNFNATVFNIGYFENKINRWLGQSGKKKFWSDWADADGRVDVDGFRTDMMELLKTHYENDKSKKFPEGMKKEKLYSFLGVKPEDLSSKDWNRAAKDFKLFISLRFDRMKDVTRGMGDNFPVNYYKAKQRFMPGVSDTKRLIKRFIGDTRKDKVGISDKIIKDGQTVAVRIDIPTYNRSNEAVKRGELDSPVYAITFHNPGSKKDDGGYSVSYKKFKDQSGQEIASTLYEAVGAIKKPKFYQDESGAEAIRSGERNKFPIATAEGQFIKNPKVPRDLSSFTEVGYNPEKHSYFYEKSTDRPVLEGDLAYFFGNTVYVKNPKFGSRSDFRFMPATAEPRPAQDKLGFFSRVEQVASGNKIPNRGSGEQMLATIAKQPGVKQEEIAWLGLEDFLRGKKQVTKDELVEFIRENDVQLEETVLTETPPDDILDDLVSDYIDQESDQYQIQYDEDEKSYLTYDPNGEPMYMFGGDLVKHADPDGAMDDLKLKLAQGAYRMTEGELMQQLGRENVYQEGEPARYQEYQLPGAEPGSYRELLLRLPKPRGDKDFTSSHFSEPNILSHVRFNDRTGPNGEKILFLEELQSDWHQEGRKRGYGGERGLDQATKELDQLLNLDAEKRGLKTGGEPLTPREAQEFLSDFVHKDYLIPRIGEENYTRLRELVKQDMATVPDAPFKSSWHELTLKRMLRYAAENGYDKLAFIDGEKTADRYDLSKKISQVMYNETSESLMAYDRLGNNVLLERGVPPEKIADYIGKEPAERLLSQPLDEMPPGAEDVKTRRLKGEELQVGGEWAFNLYDRMIPQFLKKYGKKFGAKVEDVGISIPDFVKPENFKAIDITPQMRGEEGVLGGQARFMPGIERVANNEPGLAAETVKIRPGALDGVRFMPGTKVPKITLEKIVESDPFIITADSMADMTYTVPDSGVEIKLHGGPMFSYRPGKAVWASNKGAASRIGNFVERTGQRFALIMLQNGTNHAKNKSMGRIFVEELKARSGAKKIKQGDLKKMLKFASDRAGLEKPIKNLAELEDFYAFWDWDTRGNFFQTFGLVRTPIGDPKKAGFFDYNQIVRDTTQPEFLDKPTGTVVGAIEFKSGKRFSAEELGAEPHSSYDTMLEGRGVGLFKNPPHISDVLDAPESQRSVFTLQKRLSSPNRLREAADAEKKLDAIRRHRKKLKR
jgi:hypothetical protein